MVLKNKNLTLSSFKLILMGELVIKNIAGE